MAETARQIAAGINRIALGESYSQSVLLAGVAALREFEAHIHARGPVVGVEPQSVADAINACESVAVGAVASHFDLQGAALLIARWEYVSAREQDVAPVPATEDPVFRAQIAALKEVTASLNAAANATPEGVGRAAQYLRFKQDHPSLIAALAAEIGDSSEDVHWELVDEMKDALASSAANESSDDAADQEGAIAAAESWVAENCSDGGAAEDVAMALWLRGIEEGEAFLRSQVVTQAAPHRQG